MTTEELELIIDDSETSMQKAIAHLELELTRIRASKASPGMLDGIQVEIWALLSL